MPSRGRPSRPGVPERAAPGLAAAAGDGILSCGGGKHFRMSRAEDTDHGYVLQNLCGGRRTKYRRVGFAVSGRWADGRRPGRHVAARRAAAAGNVVLSSSSADIAAQSREERAWTADPLRQSADEATDLRRTRPRGHHRSCVPLRWAADEATDHCTLTGVGYCGSGSPMMAAQRAVMVEVGVEKIRTGCQEIG